MRYAKLGSRFGMLLAISAATGTALFSSAPAASASTIANGYIQFCAQGDYSAFMHILPRSLPGGGSTASAQSGILKPGSSCVKFPFNTQGVSVQVDIVAVRSNGSQVYVGSKSWNSATGIGIGAEGSLSTKPFLYQW